MKMIYAERCGWDPRTGSGLESEKLKYCLKQFNEEFPGSSVAADLNSALDDVL